MIYKDAIKQKDFLYLASERGICVSLYLPTTPITQDIQGSRITLKNLSNEAFKQAEAIADKRQIRQMEQMIAELDEDDDFWAHQSFGLGVLLTPEKIKTYRLAYSVQAMAEVSDRFYLKPLIGALHSKSAWILAISQKSVKFYEFLPSQQLDEIVVPDLPKDFSDATGRTLQRDKAPARRLQGEEGQKVLQAIFIRAVEKAIRPMVIGSNIPLILATTSELEAIYRSFNHYDLLHNQSVTGSVENLHDEDLKLSVVPTVKQLYQERIDRWVENYEKFKNQNRAISDLATIARLAVKGQISHLLVDTDAVQYGMLSDSGAVTLSDNRSAATYDLIDEILALVLQSGGEVLAVRSNEEAPKELMPVSAILRWV